MKLVADFSSISSSREPLTEGEYLFKLLEIQDQENDQEWKSDAKNAGKTPALVFVSEVVEGDRAGAQVFDYIYTKQKDGKINKMGLGQVKGYAEAILGKEAANGPSLDTDTLPGNQFRGYMKSSTYTDKTTGEQKSNSKLTKILPAG